MGNEANQISIYKYSGERLLKIDYKLEQVQTRHEDTGAGARTKTQALLFAASWRPDGEKKYSDRPETPRDDRKGKRKKGLPDENEQKSAAGGGAWKPKQGGGGYSSVA